MLNNLKQTMSDVLCYQLHRDFSFYWIIPLSLKGFHSLTFSLMLSDRDDPLLLRTKGRCREAKSLPPFSSVEMVRLLV